MCDNLTCPEQLHVTPTRQRLQYPVFCEDCSKFVTSIARRETANDIDIEV